MRWILFPIAIWCSPAGSEAQKPRRNLPTQSDMGALAERLDLGDAEQSCVRKPIKPLCSRSGRGWRSCAGEVSFVVGKSVPYGMWSLSAG